MKSVHEVLVEARKLIEDPRDWSDLGWGWGGSRCAVHALSDAERLPSSARRRTPAFLALKDAVGGGQVGDFNDAHSHAEVLAAFDRAIAGTAPMPADPLPSPDPEESRELVAA